MRHLSKVMLAALLFAFLAVPAGGQFLCDSGEGSLCLLDRRFQVELEWHTADGQTGSGITVPSLSATGLFAFFADDRVELQVNVLDGCNINGHLWVFAAASTNVAYTLRVTDTFDGRLRAYEQTAGTASMAITDVEAFDLCDPGPPPFSLAGLEPTAGRPEGGERVMIRGEGFAEPLEVYFGPRAAEVVRVEPQLIEVMAPLPLLALAPEEIATVDVIVGLDVPGPSLALLPRAFTYQRRGSVFLSAVVPPSGRPEGGEEVTLAGGGFSEPLQVDFGGQTAAVVSILDNQIVVVTPPSPVLLGLGESLPVDVTLTYALDDPEPRSIVLPAGFTYTNDDVMPFLSAVVPPSGRAEGGDEVMLLGGGFRQPLRVSFGEQTASVLSVTANQILVATPPLAFSLRPGESFSTDVTVSFADSEQPDPEQSQLVLPNGFTYINNDPPFFLTEVEPAVGHSRGGELVTLRGGGFSEPLRVIFGSDSGLVRSVEDGEITVETPAAPNQVQPGTGLDVAVSVINGIDRLNPLTISLPSAYTYITPLFFTELVPAVGEFAGGETVSLRGGGFDPPLRVDFAGQPATMIEQVSETEIRATVPAAAPNLPRNTPAQINVTVTTALDRLFSPSVTLQNAYTYTSGTTPRVFSVTPNIGPNIGGTTVSITGAEFDDAMDVLFGARLASGVVVVSSSLITAVSPPAGSEDRNGSVDVTVRSRATGLEGTQPGGFQYGGALGLTLMSPVEGDYRGGTEVFLRGSNFEDPLAVQIAGVPQPNVSVVFTFTLRFITAGVSVSSCPPGGRVPQPGVQVTSLADGNTVVNPTLVFNYLVPLPRIISVSPSVGSQVGGSLVDLEVQDFETPVRVSLFAGTQEFSASVEGIADSTITVTSPQVPDTIFTQQACTLPDGSAGNRYVARVVDIKLRNLGTSCEDLFRGAFIYEPTDASCRPDPGSMSRAREP